MKRNTSSSIVSLVIRKLQSIQFLHFIAKPLKRFFYSSRNLTIINIILMLLFILWSMPPPHVIVIINNSVDSTSPLSPPLTPPQESKRKHVIYTHSFDRWQFLSSSIHWISVMKCEMLQSTDQWFWMGSEFSLSPFLFYSPLSKTTHSHFNEAYLCNLYTYKTMWNRKCNAIIIWFSAVQLKHSVIQVNKFDQNCEEIHGRRCRRRRHHRSHLAEPSIIISFSL